MPHQVSDLTRGQLFSQLPWWACTAWWALTMLGAVYIAPIVLVAMINPLWFREHLLIWTMSHAEDVTRWRDRVLKPVIDKYLLFETLKA